MDVKHRYDTLTLCPDYRFVRVVSREGVFYDLVRKWRVREHIFQLLQKYPAAESVGRAEVPPCVCRDFTELDGGENYCLSMWKNGIHQTFPHAFADRELLQKMAMKTK